MAKIERFEDLEIWKDSVQVAVQIYRLAEDGKLSKDWSAKDQLRRAAISISNNIAEGFEYNTNKTFIRFLTYAKGSAGELRSQLYILKEADSIDLDQFSRLQTQLIKLSKSIEGFKKYLRDFEKKRL